jgi:hypothetical protein
MLAYAAKSILDGAGIESDVLGENLALSGGPEFGINYIQLVIFNDAELQSAESVLCENGFK